MTKALLDEPILYWQCDCGNGCAEGSETLAQDGAIRCHCGRPLSGDPKPRSSAPQEPVATGCPQTVFPDQQNFTQELRATAAGFAKFPQERSTATKLIKAADLIDALTSLSPQEPDDDDETYEIGKRDGYELAVQEIDQLTGGDGEYRYVMGVASDRHCPDAATMKARIVERFEVAQEPVVDDAMLRGAYREGLQTAARMVRRYMGENSALVIDLDTGAQAGKATLAYVVEALEGRIDRLQAKAPETGEE